MKKVLEKLLAELERRSKLSNKIISNDFSMTSGSLPNGLCILAHITLDGDEWHVFDRWLIISINLYLNQEKWSQESNY